jgi:ankyrin repeat protein
MGILSGMVPSDEAEIVLRRDLDALKQLVRRDVHVLERRYTRRQLTLLMLASRSATIEMVRYLLESGSKPDLTNVHGETALMFAAGATRWEIVQGLLRAGAEVNRADNRGMTALHHAVALSVDRRAMEETVRALLHGGANPALRDHEGRLPLDIARYRRWVWRIPLIGWELRGWHPNSRDSVARILRPDAHSN